MSIEIVVLMSFSCRLEKVKKFLMKNFDESKFVTVKIYEVNVKTLISFMRRMKNMREREKAILILKYSQNKIIHQFIRSLLTHEIQSTHEVVYSVILSLKRAQNSDREAFFRR